MYLYTSNKREKANNPFYPNRVEVNNLDDLLRVAKYDHIAPAMKDNHRKEDNFLSANCCMFDLDNTHSDEPDEWKTLDDVGDAFPDVKFYYTKSRNYMKEKQKLDKKTGEIIRFEPREKYHFYAPLSKEITDREGCKALMLKIAALFPYFDLAACRPEQFYFGISAPEGGDIEGSLTIDQYIENVEHENPNTFTESVEEFAEKFHLTDEAKKAVVTIKNYFGIDSGNDDQMDINDLVLDEIPDGAEWLANADQEKSLGWLTDWAGRHNVRLGTRYRFNTKKHPNALAICTDCPWEDDHSMNGAENEAVILIEQDGRLGFLCRHSTHIWKYGWKDFRAYYEQKFPEPKELPAESSDNKPLRLILNENGTVKSTAYNYSQILFDDHHYNALLWLDEIGGIVMISGARWNPEGHPFDDVDLGYIRRDISHYYGIDNQKNILEACVMAAYRNRINLIKEALNSIEFAGGDPVSELLPRYLGAERSPYTTAVTRLIFSAAIMRIMQPGCKYDNCVILVGPQGCGKSTLIRFMAINDKWFSDSLNNLADLKSAFETIRGKWIVEMGEMIAVKRAKDVESIKSYISRQIDQYREPYTKISKSIPRQFICLGTTNQVQFLPADMTGNRRFIPVICSGTPEKHPLDDEQECRDFILQCYGQMMEEYKREGRLQLVLDDRFDEELNELRENATPDDYRIGMIQNWLEQFEASDELYVCSKLIYDRVFSKSYESDANQRYMLQDITSIMDYKIDGWVRYNRNGGRRKFKGYGLQIAWLKEVNELENGITPVSSGFKKVSSDDTENDEIPF